MYVCTKHNVACSGVAVNLIPKASKRIIIIIKYIQATGVHINYMHLLNTCKARTCVYLCAGFLGAIAVLVYGVWVGHRPEGWAYWTTVASAVMMFLSGLITSCNLRSIDEES